MWKPDARIKLCLYVAMLQMLLIVKESECGKTITFCNDSGTYNKTKPGFGRTVQFLSNCNITLTDQFSRISVPGISEATSCGTDPTLIIEENIYCLDESVTSALIDSVDGKTFAMSLQNIGSNPVSLDYYRGKNLIYMCIFYIKNSHRLQKLSQNLV